MNVHLQEVAGLAAALTAAQTNGLLAALVERPGSPTDLAARCNLDARACAHILDLLDAFDLTTRDGDGYSAGPDLKELAARSASLAQMEAELWAHAPAFLRSGTPLITMDAAPREREELYRDVVPELGKMFATAAEQLADRLSDLAPQSILDVGCGSGVWSLALARRVPGACVTGLDLPAVLEQFRARAARLGLGSRVATIAGDMHSAPIPAGQWDLAVIANVLRLEPVAAARSLIERSVAALRPGGSLLVVDALAEGTPAARQSVAVYAFHLAMRTRSGRVHTAAEIGQWMEQAGCEPAGEVPFGALPPSVGALGAIIARKAVR